MEFRDWVVAALGLPSDIDSAIEMTLQLAAKSVSALNGAASRLDEETMTGAMIGALVSAHPMSAASYPADPEAAIRWSSYTKYGNAVHSERNSGADFALVLSLPGGGLRLAVFQAKSDWSASSTKNTLVIGQIKDVPEVKDDNEVVIVPAGKRNQVEALVRASNKIQFKTVRTTLQNLTWVHYLCQFESGIKAVSISEVKAGVRTSIRENKKVHVRLEPNDGKELGLLLKQGCVAGSNGWLDISEIGDGVLPPEIDLSALVELMPVVVGREGSAGPKLEMGPDVVVVDLSEALRDVPEPTPTSTPARTRSFGR